MNCFCDYFYLMIAHQKESKKYVEVMISIYRNHSSANFGEEIDEPIPRDVLWSQYIILKEQLDAKFHSS